MGDEENVEPPSKRRKISLSLPKDRFNFSVDDEELKEAKVSRPTGDKASSGCTRYHRLSWSALRTKSTYRTANSTLIVSIVKSTCGGPL